MSSATCWWAKEKHYTDRSLLHEGTVLLPVYWFTRSVHNSCELENPKWMVKSLSCEDHHIISPGSPSSHGDDWAQANSNRLTCRWWSNSFLDTGSPRFSTGHSHAHMQLRDQHLLLSLQAAFWTDVAAPTFEALSSLAS